VQDWIIHNLDKPSTIEFLAEIASISTRSLTRIFKKKTGTTIASYRNKLRVEKANSLIAHSDYKIDHIANLCGYNSPKQLRAILKKQ
jgi:transcriptional regulator GlxA family with amidase domain